jgi:Ino eighty subunit 1
MHHKNRRVRRREGAVYRAYTRTQAQEDPFQDSDGEDALPRNISSKDKSSLFRERSMGGLALLSAETDDYGEEVSAYAAALRRVTRRLGRWAARTDELGVIAPVKKREAKGNANGGKGRGKGHDAPDDSPTQNGDAHGDITMGDADIDDHTALMDDGDDDGDDPDKTDVLVDSDVE